MYDTVVDALLTSTEVGNTNLPDGFRALRSPWRSQSLRLIMVPGGRTNTTARAWLVVKWAFAAIAAVTAWQTESPVAVGTIVGIHMFGGWAVLCGWVGAEYRMTPRTAKLSWLGDQMYVYWLVGLVAGNASWLLGIVPCLFGITQYGLDFWLAFGTCMPKMMNKTAFVSVSGSRFERKNVKYVAAHIG